MPGKSYRANVFFSLHKAMRASAVRCGLRLPSWGEYCRAVYGWLREFSKDVDRLEALDPELCAAYLNDLPNNGLVKLAENPRGFSGSYELAYNGSRKVFLEVSNTPAIRREASEYLMRLYESRCGGDPTLFLRETAEGALLAMEELKLREPREVFGKLVKDSKTREERFTLWAALLIYAQSLQLPLSDAPGVRDDCAPNVYMASKGKIQELYSLESRCRGAKRIVLVNYAGTSFIAGRSVTNEVESEWGRFFYNLLWGGTEVDIVLTDPQSAAAADAVRYKMRPRTIRESCAIDEIIPQNLAVLRDLAVRFPESRIRCFLTDVALPCAYFKNEFEDESRSNIKVDLYLPAFSGYDPRTGVLELAEECDNDQRQSFLVFRGRQPELYRTFSRNIERILENSRPVNL